MEVDIGAHHKGGEAALRQGRHCRSGQATITSRILLHPVLHKKRSAPFLNVLTFFSLSPMLRMNTLFDAHASDEYGYCY
jgi:hypothetical protein